MGRLSAEQQKKLQEFGLELALEQIPAETGNKKSGRNTLPNNHIDQQEDTSMTTETATHENKSKSTVSHPSVESVEQNMHATVHELRGLREEFRRQNSLQANGIKLAAVGAVVVAGVTLGMLAHGAITAPAKPDALPKK